VTEQRIGNTQNFVFRAFLMVALLAAASAIGYLFRFIGFPETNIVIVYLLAVLMTAWLTHGFVLGILASVIATFAFNYFFTEPYFTFTVNEPSYIITFIIMTITALVTSTLTSHVKLSALSAREKEMETKAVYNLTNHLTDAKDIHDIARIAVDAISNCFFCKAALLCFDENGIPEQFFIQQVSSEKQVRRKVQDTAEIKHQIENLRTGYDIGPKFYDWPIYGIESILGIIRIPKENASIMNDAQKRLLRSMIESTALAMDRYRSAEQRIKLREETIQERYRGNLLRAISHDLRTPLSGIIGTSEMLIDMTRPDDPRYALAEGIHKEADWLHSLVENILSLTRLQDGRLVLNKQMEAVEEVIGGAVNHIAQQSPEHEITVSVPDELLLVPMDVKLIEQVLVNLLDNATKHTPKENEISVSVIEDVYKNLVIFSVRDRGAGISISDLPYIFQMFHTSHAKHADAGHGIGLGLAICDAIIKAHGGDIEAHNRTDGQGAEFIFTLPMEGTENE
jgi:two-component system sensor histidine kinase KdpD